jgi:sec-independent protein translocase protein TatB
MFGMGGSEILVILIVALLCLGPDKLPDAATKISKGIRELRKQTRDIQNTIENDTEIGGAIRDLKSALRGDEIRPKVRQVLAPVTDSLADAKKTLDDATKPAPPPVRPEQAAEGGASKDEVPPETRVLAPEAGEHADPDAPAPTAEDDAELAKMIKPASGTVAHNETAPKAADGHG